MNKKLLLIIGIVLVLVIGIIVIIATTGSSNSSSSIDKYEGNNVFEKAIKISIGSLSQSQKIGNRHHTTTVAVGALYYNVTF